MSYKSCPQLERESSDPWPDAGYTITKKATRIPSPGDRIRVAPQGWQRRARYTAHVRSVNIDAKTVAVVRDFGFYCLPTEEVVKLSCCRADPLTFDNPEPPRQFQLNIRYEPEEGPDLPARFIVEAWWGEWCNSYPAKDAYKVWEWIDKLLTGPVCDVCGCQLARVGQSCHIFCQRDPAHRQSKETLANCKEGATSCSPYGSSRTPARTPVEEITQSRTGSNGAKANPALNRAMKRPGVVTVERTEEQWNGKPRPIYRAFIDPDKLLSGRRPKVEARMPYTYHDADREYQQRVRAES